MNTLRNFAFGALISMSTVTLISAGASAGIVCNQEGDCWHAQTEYQYQPAFGVTVHQNDWKWKENEKHAWREHEGRGYWKGGTWMIF